MQMTKKIIVIIYNNQRNRNDIAMRTSEKNPPEDIRHGANFGVFLRHLGAIWIPYSKNVCSLSLLSFFPLSFNLAQFGKSFAFNMVANIFNYTLLMVINYGYASLHFGIVSLRSNIFPHFSRLICNTVYGCMRLRHEKRYFWRKKNSENEIRKSTSKWLDSQFDCHIWLCAPFFIRTHFT